MIVAGTEEGGLRIANACIAVSTLNLHSIDVVPGVQPSQRDPIIADVLGAVNHPVATFKTNDLSLRSDVTNGQHHRIPVTGTFTIHGVTRHVAVTLHGSARESRAEVAREQPITLGDYGMALPENPMATIDPTVTIEFHIFMDRG